MKDKRMFEKLLIIFSSIVVIGLLLICYWLFLDGVYINKLNDLPLGKIIERQTTQNIYHSGDTVYTKVTVCSFQKKKNYPIIRWQLKDTVITFYDDRIQPLMDTGCIKDSVVKIEKLPKDLEEDTYHFSGELEFRINPLKTIIYKLETNDFQVIK